MARHQGRNRRRTPPARSDHDTEYLPLFRQESHRFVRRTRQSEQQPPAAGKIYGYDPDEGIAPEDRRYLLGVQANLWTEFIRTEGRASFQLLPRIYALAEIAWSPVERKSWREFSEVRLPAHLARIDASGEPYRLPAPLGIEDGTSEGESFSFVIRPPFPGCKVRYTLNGAVPQDFDREMPEKFDIAVPRGEQRTLRCVTIAPSGRRSTVTTLVLTNRMQTNNPE